MTPVRTRILAAEIEAERIARLLERAFEDEGLPVTRHETVDGGDWAVEVLFFEEDEAAAAARVRDALGGDGFAAAIAAERLPDVDWVAASLEGLAPVHVGRFVLHGRHDRARARAPVAIEVEAGLAFGTGHHETTVGCLAAIERRLKLGRPRRPLDLGTGTGVLAIALARTAHVPVIATDIDPVAVAVARENARHNAVGPLVRAITAEGVKHPALAGRFDFIVANILARPLIALAPALAVRLVPGGTLVLSGLRRDDGTRIVAAYRGQGLRLVRRDPDGHWLTLTFRR